MVRPPMAPAHLFLIDVSAGALASGAAAAACSCVEAALDAVQGAGSPPLPARALASLAHSLSPVSCAALRTAARAPPSAPPPLLPSSLHPPDPLPDP